MFDNVIYHNFRAIRPKHYHGLDLSKPKEDPVISHISEQPSTGWFRIS